ncbi:hypothetical protein IJ182_08125 [bacterium]|nr:hypothetical protein [bacterium]
MFKKIGMSLFHSKAAAKGVAEIQTTAQAALSKNLKGLEKFASTELPELVKSQQDAMAGLQQLSKNVQSMMKK